MTFPARGERSVASALRRLKAGSGGHAPRACEIERGIPAASASRRASWLGRQSWPQLAAAA